MKKIRLAFIWIAIWSISISICNAQNQEELKMANGVANLLGLSPKYASCFQTSENKIVTIIPKSIQQIVDDETPPKYYIIGLPVFLGKSLCFDADIYIGNEENITLLKYNGFIYIVSCNINQNSNNKTTFSYTITVLMEDDSVWFPLGKIIVDGINSDGDIKQSVFFNSTLLDENVIKGLVLDRNKL